MGGWATQSISAPSAFAALSEKCRRGARRWTRPRIQLGLGAAFRRALEAGGDLGDHVSVALGKFHELKTVIQLALKGLDGLDAVSEALALSHQFSGVFGIVPEVGALTERGQFIEAFCGDVPVKDASSAARSTA